MKRLTVITAILLLVGSLFLGRDAEQCRRSADKPLTVSEIFFSDGTAHQTLVSQVPATAAAAPQAHSVVIRSNFVFRHTSAEMVCRNALQFMQRTLNATRQSYARPLTESSAVDYYIISLRHIII